MQFPLEIGVGPFHVSAHLLFETLAFMVGFRYYVYLRTNQPDKISDENRMWLLIAAIFGAFIGSRLLGSLERPLDWWETSNKFLYFYANKTVVGGILGGLIMVEFTKQLIGVTYSSGDMIAYPLMLGMAIGRIGCFTSGVHEATFGIITDFPLSMDLGDGMRRHPVTLYEIAYLGLLALVLKSVQRKGQLKDGFLFQLFMVAYLIFRLLLDFIKPHTCLLWSLGSIQIACLMGLFYYRAMIARLLLRPKELFV